MSYSSIASIGRNSVRLLSKRLLSHRSFLSICPLPLLMSGLFSGAHPKVKDDCVARKADRAIRQTVKRNTGSGWSTVALQLRTELTSDRVARLNGLNAAIVGRMPQANCITVRVPSRNLTPLARLAFVNRLTTTDRNGADLSHNTLSFAAGKRIRGTRTLATKPGRISIVSADIRI